MQAWHHLPGNYGDAGSRHFRSGSGGIEEGRESSSGSNDSVGSNSEGNGDPGGHRAAGGGRRIQRKRNKGRVHGRHDDRVAARSAGGGRDRERGGGVLLSHA